MRVRSVPLPRGQAGESLLEIIITIMIMGLAIPAVVGAVMAAVGSSSQDRRQVQAQQLLTSWSETIAKKNDDAHYVNGSCPANSFYETGDFSPAALLPSGFHASVESISYWKAGIFNSSACLTEEGVRRVRLRISVDAGLYPSFQMDRDVIVRRPCLAC
jgi:type II secretory pathway pseudopilin PulG